jgi:hypothetical protein
VVKSERAYEPAIARYIDNFHLVFESLALILFVPQIPCRLHNNCGSRGSTVLGLQQSAILAVTGSSNAEASRGRFVIGLTFLRIFALIRHWKQMWIRCMFDEEENDQNASKLIATCSVFYAEVKKSYKNAS